MPISYYKQCFPHFHGAPPLPAHLHRDLPLCYEGSSGSVLHVPEGDEEVIPSPACSGIALGSGKTQIKRVTAHLGQSKEIKSRFCAANVFLAHLLFSTPLLHQGRRYRSGTRTHDRDFPFRITVGHSDVCSFDQWCTNQEESKFAFE